MRNPKTGSIYSLPDTRGASAGPGQRNSTPAKTLNEMVPLNGGMDIASAESTVRLPGNIGRAGFGSQFSKQLRGGLGVNEVSASMDAFRDHQWRPASVV